MITKSISESPLRWVGGKRWLVPGLASVYRSQGRRGLVDPFVGGGSTLYSCDPSVSEIRVGDSNHELVNFYNSCRTGPGCLIARFSEWTDDRQCFLEVRDWSPSTALDAAARFLYLNRTCYGGIYRENRLGKFNVPYGGGGRLNSESVKARVSHLGDVLARADINLTDFRQSLSDVKATDLVIIDPPYRVDSDSTFGRYGSVPFTRADHIALAEILSSLKDCGAIIVCTLPANVEILAQYDGWYIHGVRHSSRLPAGEVLFASELLPELTTQISWSCNTVKLPPDHRVLGLLLTELSSPLFAKRAIKRATNMQPSPQDDGGGA